MSHDQISSSRLNQSYRNVGNLVFNRVITYFILIIHIMHSYVFSSNCSVREDRRFSASLVVVRPVVLLFGRVDEFGCRSRMPSSA